MSFAKRAVAGLSGTVLAASALMIVGASPASAVAPSGGCWVYTYTSVPADSSTPVESTTPTSNISSGLAAWADSAASPAGAADYVLTTSGSTAVGGTRNISLTFNKGPKNGGPGASGTAYYYFSVNGTNLAAVPKSFTAPAGGTIPGDTITTSFTIGTSGATNVVFRKVIYDIPTFTTRVGCNGQTSGTSTVNPATTPLDTNVNDSFTAVGPTVSITSISNQSVTNYARKNDVISFTVNQFTDGTGTASLCNTSGTICDAGTSSVTISGGTGSGTLSAGASPTTGARALKVVSGGDTALVPLTILTDPTISTNIAGGGAGTVVTVTGTNWDPSKSLTAGGFKANPLYPCSPVPCGPYVATSDPTVSVTADSSGNFTTTFTVNDSTTTLIGGSRTHAPPFTTIFGGAPFTFSGDVCTAKIGLATTGTCSLLETVKLTVTAGDLKMSKDPGDVTMSGVTLNGSAQTSTGSLRDVTVKDYRGGVLGWSLVATFNGLTGPAKPTSGNYTLPPSAMTWTPSCVAGSNNDDVLSTGTAGAFVDATTAKPLCKVDATTLTNLGADLTSGGDTTADAGLSLAVPANQASGNYVGTITLTLS